MARDDARRPGSFAGPVAVGAPATTLQQLGEPYAGDAAMQKAWATWLGRGITRLDVYTLVVTERPIIRMIRATSPSFRTASGYGPGIGEMRIRRAFPRATDVVTYRPPSGGPPVHIFDDIAGGLAFEVQRGACIGIAVHPKRKGLSSETLGIGIYLAQKLQRS